MSKLARRNQAKQLRQRHNAKIEQGSSIFYGRDGAPKHIAVVPLSTDVNVQHVIEQLNAGVDTTQEPSGDGMTRVRVDRFRRNLLYMPTTLDLIPALDTCRLADWIIFVLSPGQNIDEQKHHFVKALEGQGITDIICVVQGLHDAVTPSKRPQAIADLKLEMTHYFASLDKVHVADNQADCAGIVRSLCTASVSGIRWRDERSWMLIESLEWSNSPMDAGPLSVTVTGTVRGKPLNPDRLIHVPQWGDFQIAQITELVRKREKGQQENNTENDSATYLPSKDRDELVALAPEDSNMKEVANTQPQDTPKGVLLDDHHYFSDDESYIPPQPKRLPKGTSSYQAAWYLDDVSDSDSDATDEEDQEGDISMTQETTQLGPEDGTDFTKTADTGTESVKADYPESEIHVDRSATDEAQALEEFRRSRKSEAEEYLEFPDEIEFHPNVLARERLTKYRGLKSLRHSAWNTEADESCQPEDYSRLLRIANYKKSKNAAANKALVGGVPTGAMVKVEILNVPSTLQKSTPPTAFFGLLQHEHKTTVLNSRVTFSSDNQLPVKSKERMIFQVGFRRYVVNPIFSTDQDTPNDVHKYDKFLLPGSTAIASFTGPLTWGAIPVLVFKEGSSPQADIDMESSSVKQVRDDYVGPAGLQMSSHRLQLIGTATTLPPSPSRVVAKRVVLTGHPYKIHKKLVTIRYMFFNREDVAWFSALPLWTKRGRRGFIKESLGTHGYFKATFDGKINPMDAVGVSLYKRVWPRPAELWSASGVGI